MPFKNAAPYLKQCVESILDQDYTDWELLAVNDHSTDESLDIVQSYIRKDTRIKAFDNIGKGIIPALQTAYQYATGSYITRMDADDIMSKDKLSVLYQILIISENNTLATGKVKYFSANGVGNGYVKYQNWLNSFCENNDHFSEIYKECVIPSPCWMVTKSDFELCGGFNHDNYPEDYDLCFRFYQSGLQVNASEKVLHHWRDYSNRTSRTDENYKDNRFISLKICYFLKIDFEKDKILYLWGAGKKAKKIAQLLIASKILFQWVSNNKKKIGKDIYGQLIYDQTTICDDSQIIIAVANEDDQKEINAMLALKQRVDSFFFA